MTDSKPAATGHNRQPSAATQALIDKGRQFYTHSYKPRDMVVERGEGARVWDTDGGDYIDLGAGIAVNALGYKNRELLDALKDQAEKIWHTSNIFFTEPPILLAEELTKASNFARRVFFTNSGAEANEAAIKLARKYAADQGRPPEKREIVTFTGSFHGRTLATVTATAQPKYHAGFEPLPGGFVYCPFNDFAAIEKAVTADTAAVMLEVIQGEGGVTPVAPGFLQHIQSLCRKHDALLILDDVQAGMGRSGKLFAHFTEDGIAPDVVTLAKGLGGGFPIGAMLIGSKVENTFQFGSHGSTFGGNPLACAAALATLDAIEEDKLLDNVKLRGEAIRADLRAALSGVHGVVDIRGEGMMIGVELDRPCAELVAVARDAGVLINVTADKVIRLVPPLMYGAAEVDALVAAVSGIVKTYLQQAA